MAGTAASQMIFFIASMIVATAVAGVFVTTVINLSKDIRDEADDQADLFKIRAVIINDATAMPYNATCSTLIIYVKNTGTVGLDYNKVTILLNGTFFTKDNMTFALKDGAADWQPEVVLEITMTNVTLASGDHSLKMWVQAKELDPFKFRI